VQVRAGYFDEMRQILVIGSDGTFATDVQPMARFSVSCIAKSAESSSKGAAGGGGRVGMDFFLTDKTPEHFAQDAARQAIIQLDAVEAPAGEMEVVLDPAGPAFCCMRRLATAWKLISIAKGLRLLRHAGQARGFRQVHRRG